MTGGGDLDEINDDDTLLDGDADTLDDALKNDEAGGTGDDDLAASLGTDKDPTAGGSDIGGRAGDSD
jgi:hypothetical protein